MSTKISVEEDDVGLFHCLACVLVMEHILYGSYCQDGVWCLCLCAC